MAQFNPDEQRSLTALLSALQGGMTGSTGYSMLQGVLSGQQNRLAARDQRVGSLIDLITNAAGSGQSYDAASALAGAYSQGSNIPPRVEDALGSLYPGAGETPGMTYADAPMPQQQSVVYQPPAPTPQDQLAELQLGQGLQDQAAQSSMGAGIASAMVASAMAKIGTVNPDTQVAITAQDVIPGLVASPTFQSLDPQTQAEIIQLAQQQLQASAAPAPGAAGSAAPPPAESVLGTRLGAPAWGGTQPSLLDQFGLHGM